MNNSTKLCSRCKTPEKLLWASSYCDCKPNDTVIGEVPEWNIDVDCGCPMQWHKTQSRCMDASVASDRGKWEITDFDARCTPCQFIGQMLRLEYDHKDALKHRVIYLCLTCFNPIEFMGGA